MRPGSVPPEPARTIADGPDPGYSPSLPPAAQWALTVLGLLLLAIAGLANWSDDYLLAAHWQVFVRFPGMAENQYYFFPMWYVTFGVPLVLFGFGLLSRRFRQAFARPWREPRLGVPLAVTALFLAVSLLPWEHRGMPMHETGTKMTFYLIIAGAGLALFITGFYRNLAFLDRPMERAFKRLMGLSRWRFILLLFGFTLILTNIISLFVFQHMPRVQDSIAQLFHARIFATGRLYLESPRFPAFFDYDHIINHGRWYSQYPFLHSLLMVPFVLLGIPWLTNPLLGALTVPVIYLLGRELYGERTGRMAGVLACVTPFIFNMSSEYMNGASALLFATLFVLFFFRTLRVGRWHQAVLTGVCIGLVANVRPYTALAVAVPFAVYGLYRLVREPRLLPRFLLMAAAGGAVASLVLVFNKLTNDDFFKFGYVVKWGHGHELGFGKSGWGEQHTPLRGLFHTGNNLNLINKFLYEWPLAGLALVLLPFAAGTRRRSDRLMLAWFLSLLAAYFFYWFHNVCFGPRFVYEAVPGLLLLTVRGVEELGPFLRRTFGLRVSDRGAFRFAGRVWPVLTLVMIAVGLPPLLRVYNRYAGVDARVVRNVRRHGLKNAVVFLHHLGHGFSANDLDLAGEVVYAKDLGVLNPALTLSYPDRQYYYANFDTLRPLGDIRFPGSRLARTLDEMAGFLDDSLTLEYASVLWPFDDIPPFTTGQSPPTAFRLPPDYPVSHEDARPGVSPVRLSGPGPLVASYREASRRIFDGSVEFDDYLPALACWLVGDRRERLKIFSTMNDLRNLIIGDYRLTLLYITSDGLGAVYDISLVTGTEPVFGPGPAVIPLR